MTLATFRVACFSPDFRELGTSFLLPDCEVRFLANFFFGVEDAFLLSLASLFGPFCFLPEPFEVPLEEFWDRIRAVSGFSDRIFCVDMLEFE